MRCPVCGSSAIRERPERTAQGYRRFRCRRGKQFNERSADVLNKAQYPSDVIALVVLWRLRYKLSLRDLAEMFLTRGFIFTYEAVREWEAKLTPALAENLRRKRKGRVGRSWYVDETFIRVRGQWRYLYRAIDRDGALVDVMLSEHRDLAAARAFFRSAKTVTGVTPVRVTTDGHDAYPRALRTELGGGVRHRMSCYLNNRLEQDHRGIKGRCRPMLGFKNILSAKRYCRSYDELRSFLRCRSRMMPTRSCRNAALAAHAEDSYCPSRDRLKCDQHVAVEAHRTYRAPKLTEPCLYPWERLLLKSDGQVQFCPSDWRHGTVVGNFEHETLSAIWQGEAMQAVRRAHVTGDFRNHQFCGHCPDWSVTKWPCEGRSYATAVHETQAVQGNYSLAS